MGYGPTCKVCGNKSAFDVRDDNGTGERRFSVCETHMPRASGGADRLVARSTRDAVGQAGLWLRRIGGF